jgi:hypothetical protein
MRGSSKAAPIKIGSGKLVAYEKFDPLGLLKVTPGEEAWILLVDLPHFGADVHATPCKASDHHS